MHFHLPLVEGRLIQRYKRFLADIELLDGRIVTAHCANPGAMLGLKHPGMRVLLAPSRNPKTKLAYSFEIADAELPGGQQLVGINTSNPNRLVEEALRACQIPELDGYAHVQREVAYGENSRVDFLLTDADRPPCFVEVKNCHLMRQAGLAEFPDSVTTRGAKHLRELAREVTTGNRAVMLFVIQMRAETFSIARDLDPSYAQAFHAACSAGVEAMAYTCELTENVIRLDRRIPVLEHSQILEKGTNHG